MSGGPGRMPRLRLTPETFLLWLADAEVQERWRTLPLRKPVVRVKAGRS